MGCLYQLESPGGKRYIGISHKTAEKRWHAHQMRTREGRNNALQQAIRKYGAASFKVATLAIADNWDYLCDLEKKAIKAFGTKSPNGYNLTEGGEGVVGNIVSNDTRARQSAAQRRRFGTDSKPKKIRMKQKRLPVSISAQRAAAKALRESMSPEEFKIYCAQRTREGMAVSSVREKVIAAAKERASNQSWRDKIGERSRGRTWVLSQSSKDKISSARKLEWADPIIRERRLAALEKVRNAKKKTTTGADK